MSFSKAPVKRFNDVSGCAPPVGAYDPKEERNLKGAYIEKSDRFKHPKDVAPNSDYMEYFHHSQLTSSTPRKCGSANSSSSSESSNRSVARKSTHFSDHTGRSKDLELELRRLLHVKGEQDRELRQLREKCQNLEGRLNNADVDHTLCLAHAATLEAETKEAKSQLKVLQMQLPVQMQQKHEKLVQSLRQEHEAKSKELRQELEAVKEKHDHAQQKMQKAQQEVDILQQMLQKSQEACSSCEQKLQALQEESSKTQQQMHSLQLERERLQQALAQQGDVCAVTEQRLQAALQARDQGEKQMEQAQQKCYDLQQQLQQMQENHSKLQEQLQEELHSTKENLAKLQQSGISVEEESKNLKLAKKDLEVRGDLMFDAIRSLKEEAYSESDVMKQQLFEELAENALLKEHIEQLEQENKLLNETIQSLTVKHEVLEEKLASQEVQEEKTCSQLKMQVNVLQQNLQTLQDELECTKLTNKDLVQSLTQLKDELSCTKSLEHGKEKELEVLSHAKLDLEAAIKSLMVDLHAVQQREEGAQSQVLHFQTQVQQLQVTEQDLKMQLEQQVTLADQEQNKLKDKLKRATEERHKLVEKHCEELQSVKKALALDHQEMDAKMSELALRLDRSQNFNRQMKDELKKLLADKEKLQQQICDLEKQVKKSQDELETHQSEFREQEEMLHLKLTALQEELMRLKGQEDEFQSALSNSEELAQKYKKQFLQQTEKCSELENEVKDMEAEKTMLQSQIDSWKNKYDELYFRVEPFMEQLDAFAAERELLLGQRQQDEAEVAKLMEKCAKLLGHQNHRQKIQYINKMKDEFMKCRKEKEELKGKVAKQNNAIQKLERRLQILEGKKLVDPVHLRKDQQPLRSPLRQANTNIQ
ncbi:hyaluronan mediated motility receptor-like isoform X2 [Pomacea canaliculata]|uniref:hyaluronan mediated motility receptor-like isoform X2 n=1 Tax=Pomacea canaliculata TaxID=400727 RepID=UPI000D72DFDD|nr:hyaluronan mediated motility receptor-like isoform X2 [Pomacea canaliculata]